MASSEKSRLFIPASVKVAAFTKAVNVPATRFRVRQLIPGLLRHGVEMSVLPDPTGKYSSLSDISPSVSQVSSALKGNSKVYSAAMKAAQRLWFAGAVCARVPGVIRSYRHDVTFLQRELTHDVLTLEPLTKRPRVLDVDDAIWLNGRGDFAGRLANACDLVICGNDYLADYFARWNKDVVVLPTPVDAVRFAPLAVGLEPPAKIIGWSGSASNHKYLFEIEDALAEVLKNKPEARLRIVSDVAPRFGKIPPDQLEFIKWTPENEAVTIQEMTVGLMPLRDTEWEKGKCSYKMLLYMSCGIPVVVSPVGMNVQVLSMGKVGVTAASGREWVDALLYLLGDPAARESLGRSGRRVVLERFSLDVVVPELAGHLRRVVG
jgi:glycosyltransferase involved in cell wall biosynthesis